MMAVYSHETQRLVTAANAAKRAERKATRPRQTKRERPDAEASTGINGLRQRDPRELDRRRAA